MRRLLGLVTVTAVLAMGAGSAATPAATTHSSAWGKCGPRFTFLIWPNGHPALPAIKFPHIQNPHVEAYLDFGKEWPDARAGAYVVGGKPPTWLPNADVLGPCLNYGSSSASAEATIAGAVTIKAQTAVQCTFPATGVIDTVQRPGGIEIMLLHAGKKLLARATATPTGATLTAPAKSCHRLHSPG